MSKRIPSYGKVYALGHKAISELLNDAVVVEEKVDGSQFSFGVYDGELLMRSKGEHIEPEAPPGMFTEAVQVAKQLAPHLHDGWTYRCEYLRTPKHNTLAYDRVPANHFVLFDLDTGLESYVSPDTKSQEAERLGLETPQFIYEGRVTDMSALDEWLETDSALGGQKVEGVVLKNYERFGKDGKILAGKYVSERFKETHKKDWKGRNESGSDIKYRIAGELRTEAIWEKAVQHAREMGQLEDDPRDIGTLMKLLNQDIEDEHADDIKDRLYQWARKDILRMATRGFPEWYKRKLAEQQPTEVGSNQ